MIDINDMILFVLEYALMLPRTLLGLPAVKRLWTTKSPTKNAAVLGRSTNGMKNSRFFTRMLEKFKNFYKKKKPLFPE
jgi:hypothetical protein